MFSDGGSCGYFGSGGFGGSGGLLGRVGVVYSVPPPHLLLIVGWYYEHPEIARLDFII